jgi:hypothetical protein
VGREVSPSTRTSAAALRACSRFVTAAPPSNIPSLLCRFLGNWKLETCFATGEELDRLRWNTSINAEMHYDVRIPPAARAWRHPHQPDPTATCVQVYRDVVVGAKLAYLNPEFERGVDDPLEKQEILYYHERLGGLISFDETKVKAEKHTGRHGKSDTMVKCTEDDSGETVGQKGALSFITAIALSLGSLQPASSILTFLHWVFSPGFLEPVRPLIHCLGEQVGRSSLSW